MKVATCHPDQKHYARGLCTKCYTVATREERAARTKIYREANKEAIRTAKAEAYRNDREQILAKQKAKYDANPEVVRARVELYRQREPEKVRQRKKQAYTKVQEADLMRRYGMTRKDVEDMLAEQDGRCAVCEDAINFDTKRVDHCHATGLVRGLLCWNCNTAIGKLGDTAEGVRKALNYLEKAPSKFKA